MFFTLQKLDSLLNNYGLESYQFMLKLAMAGPCILTCENIQVVNTEELSCKENTRADQGMIYYDFFADIGEGRSGNSWNEGNDRPGPGVEAIPLHVPLLSPQYQHLRGPILLVH